MHNNKYHYTSQLFFRGMGNQRLTLQHKVHSRRNYCAGSFYCLSYFYLAPFQNQVSKFWRMIWENRLPTVVMLTRCFEGKVSSNYNKLLKCWSLEHVLLWWFNSDKVRAILARERKCNPESWLQLLCNPDLLIAICGVWNQKTCTERCKWCNAIKHSAVDNHSSVNILPTSRPLIQVKPLCKWLSCTTWGGLIMVCHPMLCPWSTSSGR